jgi:cell wall-associated NlpC family hydrolase
MTLLSLPGYCSAAETPQANTPDSTHPAVTVAKQMIGKPYRYGSASPERGFDCSGLVYYSFKRVGINVPRTSETLYRNAFPVAESDLRQGDLLFFRIEGKVSHVGIYTDGDNFLHAPSSGKAVTYGSLSNPYWREHLIQAGRLF